MNTIDDAKQPRAETFFTTKVPPSSLQAECAGLLSTRNGMLRYMHTPETINALNHSLPPQQEAVSFQAEKRCS
ncbi:hypothetical protein ESCO106049_23985 [Escherichia coli]